MTCTSKSNLNSRTLPVSHLAKDDRDVGATGICGCTGSLLVSVRGISAGGTVLKALIRATVDPLMSRCRQHIISLYSCNQLLSYATFSECAVHSAVAYPCSLPTMQGANSITSTTKSDYCIKFRTKQFTGCVEKGIVVLLLLSA